MSDFYILQKINEILEKVIINLLNKWEKEKKDEEFFKKILNEKR